MLNFKNSIFLHDVRVAILSFKLCERLRVSEKNFFYNKMDK